jgi:hypothetical protein
MPDKPTRPSVPSLRSAAKVAIVPILGIVLYSVLPGDGEPELAASVAAAPVRNATVPAAAPRRSVPILATPRPVEHIVARDPFALPDALRPTPEPTGLDADQNGPPADELAESPAETWEAIRNRWMAERTSIVLTTPAGPVAVVGNRRLRIGDEVEPGVRVVDIRRDGVVLEFDAEPTVPAP